MWRKVAVFGLLALSLLLLARSSAQALDWSTSAGYAWRRFSPIDQLGATSPEHYLHLKDGHGPAMQATLSTDWDLINVVLKGELAYLMLTGQPAQPYVVKGRTILTDGLVSPYGSVGVGLSRRFGLLGVGLVGGVAIQAISETDSLPFDYDAVAFGSLFVSGRFENLDVRASWNVFLTPTVEGPGQLDVSHGIFVAIGATTPPLRPVRVVVMPEETTNTVTPLPEPATTTHLPQLDHQTDVASEGVVKVLLANKKLSVEVRIRTSTEPRAQEAAERFRQQLLAKGIAEDRISMKVLDDGKFAAHHLIRFVFVVSKPK